MWVTKEKFSSTAKIWKNKPMWSVEVQQWYGNDTPCLVASDFEAEFLLGFVPQPSSCQEIEYQVQRIANVDY